MNPRGRATVCPGRLAPRGPGHLEHIICLLSRWRFLHNSGKESTKDCSAILWMEKLRQSGLLDKATISGSQDVGQSGNTLERRRAAPARPYDRAGCN